MADALKVGLAGVGTVGGGLLQLLAAHGQQIAARAGRPIKVVALSTLEDRRNKAIDISKFRRVQDPVALAADPEIDVFVELMGGEGGVAKASVEAALRAGKHVVTANKAMLAHHGAALATLAEKHGVALNFEAAVAGGIPVVKAVRESLQGNDISRVYGILNGTCNYILTQMEKEGTSFAEVLKEAQAQGYAEADPTFDIGGFDTAHKLALLTSLAFGTRTDFDSVYIEGIEQITPADIEAHNANLVGGDIAAGVSDLRQFFTRPTWRTYSTPVKRLYICSASTPPGVGVHGMCGYYAARLALRQVFGVSAEDR